VRSVVGRVHDKGIVGDTQFLEEIEYLSDVLVVVHHRIVIRRLPAAGLTEAFLLGVREQVHMREVEPQKERFAVLVDPRHEILGSGDELVVAGFHPLGRERTGVGDLLLADTAPAGFLGRVILVGRPTVDDPARPECFREFRKVLLGRVIVHLRLFLGIEMVEIAEEFVEAVHGRQEFVEIAEVVLAELGRWHSLGS
jgi:hypothetical protein